LPRIVGAAGKNLPRLGSIGHGNADPVQRDPVLQPLDAPQMGGGKSKADADQIPHGPSVFFFCDKVLQKHPIASLFKLRLLYHAF
jgi:hypothetical protein